MAASRRPRDNLTFQGDLVFESTNRSAYGSPLPSPRDLTPRASQREGRYTTYTRPDGGRAQRQCLLLAMFLFCSSLCLLRGLVVDLMFFILD
jgi:hypothetical protein